MSTKRRFLTVMFFSRRFFYIFFTTISVQSQQIPGIIIPITYLMTSGFKRHLRAEWICNRCQPGRAQKRNRNIKTTPCVYKKQGELLTILDEAVENN
jgi:hypothetical protein